MNETAEEKEEGRNNPRSPNTSRQGDEDSERTQENTDSCDRDSTVSAAASSGEGGGGGNDGGGGGEGRSRGAGHGGGGRQSDSGAIAGLLAERDELLRRVNDPRFGCGGCLYGAVEGGGGRGKGGYLRSPKFSHD